MKDFALVTDGIVINIVCLDDDRDPEFLTETCDVAVELPPRPHIGWTYDGTSFAFAEIVPPVSATFDRSEVVDILAAIDHSSLDQKKIDALKQKLGVEAEAALAEAAATLELKR